MMAAFDDRAGEFFFGRGSDCAVDAGQINQRDLRPKLRSALSARQSDSYARIICGMKSAAGEPVHQRSLARVGDASQTDRQEF